MSGRRHLTLRTRVFLFFTLLAGGALVISAGALALGWSRADGVPTAPFVTAFITFALINSALLVGIWLLFDENVAKPITRLSNDMRLGEDAKVDIMTTRYLGDLGPAAEALMRDAAATLEDSAAHVARETARLGAEHARLTALLTEMPIATLLLNPAREIVLYDAQAASILKPIAMPRLKAPLTDYFEAEKLEAAIASLTEVGQEASFELCAGDTCYSARVNALGDDGHLVFVDVPEGVGDDIAPRPLVFDFGLMRPAEDLALRDRPLRELCFVVLDLETTGLSVAKDDIVQMAACRVLGGGLVQGEEFLTNVDPGRPIPPASTRIHHVSDADVKGAPGVVLATRQLHHFARDAVIVAHNAPFDLGLLKRQESRTGAAWDHPVLDTVLLSAVAFGTTEDHSLDALCARLSVTIAPEDRHTALGDARATAQALVKLLKIVEARGLDTFAALQPELDRQAKRLYSGADLVHG